jgi:hypothetical protein
MFNVETVIDDDELSCDALSVASSSFVPDVHWMDTMLDMCTVSGPEKGVHLSLMPWLLIVLHLKLLCLLWILCLYCICRNC